MTKRDISKLVRVQRTVTRRGRTYQQFYYVKPADVKATDTIVGNQQVLDEYKKVKAQGVNATEKLDIAKFNTLRYSGDRELAFKYAEACGIQWKKCSHPGIDWMRMVMAVDRKTNGELKKVLRATTGKGLISNRQNRIKREINSTANFDSLSGKNKVRVLKSALFSYNDLPELAGLLGVTWKASTDPAINNMRVQVALSKYMENISAQTFTDTLSAKLADVNTKVKSKQLEKLKKAEEERKKKEEEERKKKEEEAKKKAEEERKKKEEEEAKKKAEEEKKKKEEEERKKKAEEEAKNATTGNPLKALAEMDEEIFNHGLAHVKVRTIELLLNSHGDIEKLRPVVEKLGIDTTGMSLSKVKSALIDYFEHPYNTLDTFLAKLGLEEERKAFLNKANNTEKSEKSEDKDTLEDADEAKVVADKNAPQRVKNLTDLINKVTSQKDLDLIAKSGIIPEDDKAKTYTTSLLSAYDSNVRSSGSTAQLKPFDYISSVRGDYKIEADILKDLKKAVPGLTSSDFFSVNCKELTSGFLGGDYVHFNTTTLPFSLVKGYRPNGFSQLLSNFDRDLYMSYRTAHEGGEALYDVIKDIDISYNDYSNDTKFVSVTSDYNNQYGNPKVDENEFASHDINKTGMIKVLNRISNAYPEYKEEGQNLIQEYKDMLKDCDNVPAVLHNVLHYNTYSEFEETRNVLKRNIEIAQYMDNYFSKFDLTKDEYHSLINGALPRQLGSYNIAGVPDMPSSEFVVYKNGATGYSIGSPSKSIPLDNNFKEGLRTIIDKYSSIIPPRFNETYHNGMYYTSPKDTEGYLVDVSSVITSFLRARADGRKEKYYTQAQESLDKIDIKKYNKIYKDILDFQGCKVYNPETQQFFDDNYDDSMSQVKSNPNAGALALVNAYDEDKTTKRNNILANVRFLRNKDRLLTSVEEAVNSASASASNDNGKNKSQQYSYCNPKVILRYRSADTITQSGGKVRRYSTDISHDISLEDLTHKMEEQLSNSEILSPASLGRIQDLTDTQAHAILVTRQSMFNNSDAYNMGNFASRENYMQTAYGELYANALGEMATYTPHAIRTSKKKGEYVDKEFAKKSIYKKLSYVPYDDKVAQANTVPDTQKAQHTLLKKLRTDALKKVHCSLASLSDAKEKEIEHYVKVHWDTDGTEKQGSEQRGYAKGINKSFANISAEFVTGAYKINNQEMDDILAEQAKSKSQTPQLYFHGTTKAGVCGIIGVDGKFKYKKTNGKSANGTSSNGAMLGHGIYLADCAGKSAKYFDGYSYKGGSHGALFLCNAIMGKNVVEKGYGNSYNDPNSDSVFMAQGTKYGSRMFPRTLMANEWCVRDTNFLAPQYVVDMACVRRK